MSEEPTPTTTVDEHNLKTKCDSLMAEANECRLKMDRLVRTCDVLGSIKRPDGEEGTQSPPDERTGAPMTDATRYEIYAANIAIADRLLGLTPAEEEDESEEEEEEDD